MAVEEDINTIVRMGRLFWVQTPYRDIPYCQDSVAATCRSLIESGLLFVAEIDGKVVGMIGAAASPLYANRDYLVSAELFWWVEPEYRNSGIGRLMMRSIEKAAREIGVCRLSMSAFDDLDIEKASAIYKAAGYSPIERTFGKIL